jgi:lipopolysaccharide/colanic/teichoic acid biosynthesis glycosyltransferase
VQKYKNCQTAIPISPTHFFLYIYAMNLGPRQTQPVSKTVIEYFITIICLIVFIPVGLLLAVLIRLTGKGPVIYTQQRSGRFGVSFTIYKFRSMYFGTEEGIPLVSGKDDKRITIIGHFMRKHKLDEIPNFINVLKGEMSLVGPRPEQQYFIDQIIVKEPKYSLLQNLKPGITSWGQVKYGYASNVDQMIERLNYDLYYLKNRSLWFDMKIIFYTIRIIFKGEGI